MWDETGMSRGYAMKDLSRAKGYCAISPSQGINSLLISLAHRSGNLLIGLDSSKSHIQRFTLDCQNLQQLTALFTAKTGELSLGQLHRSGIADRFGTPTQCQFVQMDEMPLTDSGEVDLKQLTYNYTGLKVTEQTEPRNQVERQLAEIFQKVLGLEKIGIHDNFFQLGGHSVLAAQIVSQIQETFESELPLWVLFESSTIAELAQILEKPQPSSEELTDGSKDTETALTLHPCLVSIQPNGNKTPFFWIHPGAGLAFPYYPVIYQLGSDRPIYGIQSPGLRGEQKPLSRVEDMADYYIQVIRSVQPQGPYLLAGWSLGAYIAYEMAIRLKQANQDVELLVLFDNPPDWRTGYTASDRRRIAGFLVSLREWLPFLYDYLALIGTDEDETAYSQLSKDEYQTKYLIRQMLSLFGHRSKTAQSTSQNSQTPTRIEKACITLRMLRVWVANMSATLHYRARSYDGKVILLKTSGLSYLLLSLVKVLEEP
ncbi:MAG: alpha/beta fold hydrolase [Moorea sp. SIO2B7]|nr:alpha/beta fold hydrolase [Moorena sp. SIO2B7]